MTGLFKRCTCTHPGTRRLVGASCPKLRRSDTGGWNPHHGLWGYQLELPRDAAGNRRQLRRSTFTHRDHATDERDAARALLTLAGDDQQPRREVGDLLHALAPGEPLPDRDALARRIRAGVALHSAITTGDYLDQWLTSRKSKLSPNTYRSYEDHIRMYFRPQIGHIPLQKLRTFDIQRVFNHIDDQDLALIEAQQHADPEIRANVKGKRVRSAASQHRFLATIRKALNDAIKIHKVIEYNPAIHVELAAGAPPKPRLWTDAAVERWKKTGYRPSAVMVWTPAQFGRFLDYAAVRCEELVEMYELIGYRGLRRGEACGLPEHLVHLGDDPLLELRQQITSVGYQPVIKDLKSDASERDVLLAEGNVISLRRYRKRRNAWELAAGADWIDTEFWFVRPDGSAWHPERISQIFDNLVRAAGLPPIRLHDLRHLAATLMHAAGASMKEIQETLGHAKYQTTADLYTSILQETQKTTAAKVIQLVPRRLQAA